MSLIRNLMNNRIFTAAVGFGITGSALGGVAGFFAKDIFNGLKGVMGNPITGTLVGGAIGGIAGYALGGPFGSIIGFSSGSAFGGLIGNYLYQKDMASNLSSYYNLGGFSSGYMPMPSYAPIGFSPMMVGGFNYNNLYGGMSGMYFNPAQMMQLYMMQMMIQMMTQMQSGYGMGMPYPIPIPIPIPIPVQVPTPIPMPLPNVGYGNIAPNSGVQIPRYGSNPSKDQIARMIEAAAYKYGIPVNILKAIAYNESRWNPRAVGDHGRSFGMMQVYTKAHPDYNVRRGVVDPAYNIEYAARLLRRLYDKYHDWGMAVRRYNGAGPMAVRYEARVMTFARTQPWRKWGVA